MPAPRCRPFTVLDGMILIAATAVGLALYRVLEDPRDWWNWRDIVHPRGRSVWGIIEAVETALLWIAEPAWTLTLTLACLALRKPRPALRRLAREPGFAACAAVVMATAFLGSSAIVGSLARRAASTPWNRFELAELSSGWQATVSESWRQFGLVVAAVWGLLAVTGSLRPRPTWIDRAGRILGVYWFVIAVALAVEVFEWAGQAAF
jgi:hypothetical protein